MKKGKILKRLIAVFCITAFLASSFVILTGAESKTKNNRFNVVFVTDYSGSMGSAADTEGASDPFGLRIDAIDMFLSIMAQSGNNVGVVAFNDGIVYSSEVKPLNSKSSRKNIINKLKEQKAQGFTNVGGALLKATKMLDEAADPEKENVIILLSDGETEMGSEKEYRKSINNKNTAITAAREKEYKVYTIGLYTSSRADSEENGEKELMQIAGATGGVYDKVKDAKDLKDVLNRYYDIIFSTVTKEIYNDKTPQNGIIESDFDVVEGGAEELNIAVIGSIKNYEIIDSKGRRLTDAEIEKISYKTDSAYIFKLVDPQEGKWHIKITAEPGTNIRIVKIYNSDLSVNANLEYEKEFYKKGDIIKIRASVFDGENKITSAEEASKYSAVLVVKNHKDEILNRIEAKNFDENGFYFEIDADKVDSYSLLVNVSNEEIFAQSQPIKINIGNSVPTAENEDGRFTKFRFYLPGHRIKFSVDNLVTDADSGDTLKYEINSQASFCPNEDYEFDGKTVAFKSYDFLKLWEKSAFAIEAVDSHGAVCEIFVRLYAVNILYILAFILIVALSVSIAVIVQINKKRFMGVILISKIVDSIPKNVFEIIKGNKGLNKFYPVYNAEFADLEKLGFDKSFCIQATSKNYVYIKSKIPFTVNGSNDTYKKYKLESKYTNTNFYSSKNLSNNNTCGLSIRFESMLRHTESKSRKTNQHSPDYAYDEKENLKLNNIDDRVMHRPNFDDKYWH